MSAPRLVSSGADHALGEVSGHLIGVWDGAVALESVQRWRRQIESLVRAAPGRVVYLSYERSGFQMPSDPVRKLIADTLRTVDGRLAACAVVLPGHSFASAAVRALVSGISMVARPKSPLRCLASVDEAHAWVSARLQPGTPWPDRDELHAAIAMLEANVGARG